MAVWIAMAVLAAAATIALLVPLTRSGPGAAVRSAEMAIYRDQLDEVARDVSRGILPAAEADAARTEIARRLLKADALPGEDGAKGSRRVRIAALVAMVVIPAVSLAVYWQQGSPDLPDLPIAERADEIATAAQGEAILANMAAQLRANPDNAELWEQMGSIYLQLGMGAEAVEAFTNVIRISGPDAQRELALGMGIVMVNQGTITASAREAFDRVLALDPGNVGARFYLAEALMEDGDSEAAIAAWQDLLADEPPGSTWGDFARAALRSLGVEPPPAPAAADPTNVTPEQIEAMVAGLAARLAAEPNDAEGWAQLIRSYIVLGRPADAQQALATARTAMASDPAGLALVEDAWRSLELP